MALFINDEVISLKNSIELYNSDSTNENNNNNIIDILKSITIKVENDEKIQQELNKSELITILMSLLSIHNKKPISDDNEDTSNNEHGLTTEDNWKLSILTNNYNTDLDNIGNWNNIRDLIMLLLVKLCRRSIDKSTSCIANIESIANYIDLLVATFWVMLNSESGSLACCWLVMILASDSNDRQRSLGKSKASEIIIAMMHRYIRIPINAEFACRAVRNLAADDDVAVQLVDDGICDVIASLININNDNADVILAAFWAIINLSCDSNVSTLLGSAGCCDSVVNASFKIVADTEDGAKASCWAIRNLASATAFNYSLLAATKVCDVIMYISNKHPDSNDVKEEISWLIATLACDKELSERLGSLGACQLVLKYLNEREQTLDLITDATFIEASTMAICNLSSNCNSNQVLIGNIGGVELLTMVLAKYVDDVSTNIVNESKYEIDVESKLKEESIDHCIVALFNLMFDCDDNKNRVVSRTDENSPNLIPLLTKIFNIYVDSLKSSRNVIETLMRMLISISINHDVNRQAIFNSDNNILALVVKALKKFANDEDIVRTSCEVFIHLHYYSETHKQELIDKQLVDDQLRVIKLMNNDDDTIEKVINLWNLENIIHS